MKIVLAALCLVAAHCVAAQKYAVSKSSVVFFSDAAIEDITAKNTKSAGLFDGATGEVAFSIPIKEFIFDKALMQEHFNERYLESDKFPKSTFEGRISGYKPQDESRQTVRAIGKLTIHGVSRDVDIPGTIERKSDQLSMMAKFIVKLEDHQIKIPQLMWQKIAEQVEVTIDFTFKESTNK